MVGWPYEVNSYRSGGIAFRVGDSFAFARESKDHNNGLFVSFAYGVGVPWIAAVYAENCGVDTAAHAISSAPLDNDRRQRRRRRGYTNKKMSWLPVPPGHYFSINNIPFGIISTPSNTTPRPAVAIGEYVLDLHAFATTTSANGFSQLPDFTQSDVFTSERTLNHFASLGRTTHGLVRGYLQKVLSIDTPYPELLRDNPEARKACLLNTTEDEVRMHLPMDIGDYSDFYSGRNHAFNVGVLFRGPENALQPNYEHLPVGYHGRASSVVVSGTRVRRPRGQVIRPGEGEGAKVPVFAESGKLDFELELAVFVGRGSELGSCVGVDEAGEYLFGVVVMNDWSGLFLKLFFSFVDGWVVCGKEID